jgi:hypothetical protein
VALRVYYALPPPPMHGPNEEESELLPSDPDHLPITKRDGKSL